MKAVPLGVADAAEGEDTREEHPSSGWFLSVFRDKLTDFQKLL